MGVDDTGAVRANLQDALDIAEALGLRGGGVNLLDELGLLFAGRLDLELLGLLAQLGDLHGREFLARKRGLGGGGVALLVALLAVALTIATVVVAVVLALVALVVALMLTTVGAGTFFGLGTLGSRGCGRVGAGRGLSLCLDVSVAASVGLVIGLLLGSLGLCRLLARALGLLGSRLVGDFGVHCNSRIGGLISGGLGVGGGLDLGLRRALCRGTTAATGANIGGLSIGRCGSLGGRSVLNRSLGCSRRLNGHRSALSSSCCGSGFLGLNKRLGLAAATVRTQSRVNGGNFVGLNGRNGLGGGSALPCCRTNRSLSDLKGRLLGRLLRLGCRTATRARSRLLD